MGWVEGGGDCIDSFHSPAVLNTVNMKLKSCVRIIHHHHHHHHDYRGTQEPPSHCLLCLSCAACTPVPTEQCASQWQCAACTPVPTEQCVPVSDSVLPVHQCPQNSVCQSVTVCCLYTSAHRTVFHHPKSQQRVMLRKVIFPHPKSQQRVVLNKHHFPSPKESAKSGLKQTSFSLTQRVSKEWS